MGDATQVVFGLARLTAMEIQLLGTCFSIGGNKVATAAHVVGADHDNLVVVAPTVASINEYQDTSDTSADVAPVHVTAYDPIHDLCVLQFNEWQSPAGFELGSADDIPPGSPVILYGFPHATQSRLVFTQQTATVGARILLASAGMRVKHIVLNTQSRDGQSGSPIVDANTGAVGAVLIGSYAPEGGGGISLGGIDPQTLHQTTHAVSAEYLKRMV